MGTIAEPVAEDQTVRQYRFLLRTAPLDALQSAHHEGLDLLDEDKRARILRAVQDGLVAGQRLRPGDTGAIARLVSIGERRNPRGFLDACEPMALGALADAVIHSEAAFGLFAGYAAWDGLDPAPADVGVDHGGDGHSTRPDPAVAEARALANSHSLFVTPWAGGGF
ncbi:hypothetical protein BJ986_001571 [Phycicoccus badiiscoriae]|uniref:Uncharacterized protein n=1 Tax=Pedococcus badiiscoriae TaxID=642776 RepID=A0A852WK72_9MICO|nr:hypothetical protein [Pedococcus badiiscoriae]NYG07084.1 hypothetical protein [Pedococcus badiiscoriae]